MAIPRREREILALVEAGCTSVEIAGRLGLSPRSVDSAIERARQRLGARTRLHAALLSRLVPEERGDEADAPVLAAEVDDHLDDHIDDALRALIIRLSQGATVTAAARAAGLSRRSASRRLAELRDRLGAGSTSQTVALACRHLVPGGYRAAS